MKESKLKVSTATSTQVAGIISERSRSMVVTAIGGYVEYPLAAWLGWCVVLGQPHE